jgi:hypothetical protein
MNYKAVDIKDAGPQLLANTAHMKLRLLDLIECRMVGSNDTKESIIKGVELSRDHFCKIGVNTITDRPEFIFGVASTPDPTVGSPWLLATSDFKITTDWLKRCKKEMLPEINKTFPILRNFIHKENKQSKTWLKWLGFKFYDTRVSFHTDGRIAPAQVFIKLGD